MPFQRILVFLLAIHLAALATPLASAEATADIGRRFSYVEETDAVQPGCTVYDEDDNPCHQMAGMMNGLDSPKIDVLILVPASPFAERDLRIMRQSVQMWADGVDFLSADMGLQWMADGVEFHIAVEMVDVSGNGEAHFTTYPIWDPEIVVVATNPVGLVGTAIDPIEDVGKLFGESDAQGPCHGVKNPFDITLWQNLPGYNSHHGGRSGTYVEDCDGAGGNICFAVNLAVDPEPTLLNLIQLYDMVSHEVGHCLSLGHVGDGNEGPWSSVPTYDIMAYSSAGRTPTALGKCVSTLDVETLAVRMSRYLDVNGDGKVDEADYLYANSAHGNLDRPFQIQHPDNHYYASPTRQAIDCPQPDMGLVPLAEVVNFTPLAPARTQVAFIDQDKPVSAGPVALHGIVNGSGAVDRVVLNVTVAPGNDPAEPLRFANVMVPVIDGTWAGTVDLSLVPQDQTVIVAAVGLDAQGVRVDSDRVAFVVTGFAPTPALEEDDADAPNLSSDADAPNLSSDADASSLASGVVVLALAAMAAVVRHK